MLGMRRCTHVVAWPTLRMLGRAEVAGDEARRIAGVPVSAVVVAPACERREVIAREVYFEHHEQRWLVEHWYSIAAD